MRTLTLAAALLLPFLLTGQSKKYEIQKPSGHWQKPGEIQVPKGIQAIRVGDAKCEHRMIIGADALFEFDKATLTKDAEETMAALGPMLKEKADSYAIVIEGHTDSIGDDAYNQRLSEKRADAVRQWLISHSAVAAGAVTTKGFGRKRPAVPNAKPDGSDDAEGRRKNRRVEVVINTCK